MDAFKTLKSLKCTGIVHPFIRKNYTFEDYQKHKESIQENLPELEETNKTQETEEK
jgi:hypothetical protein